MTQPSLEILVDDDGSVVFGWAGDRVFVARWSGGMSAALGEQFVARLQGFVDRSETLHYFSDASGLSHYDLRARGDLVRLILANRSKFESVVMLNWSEGVSAASRIVASSIGDPVEILTDTREFDSRLLRLAPSAKHLVEATLSRAKIHPPPTPEQRHRDVSERRLLGS